MYPFDGMLTLNIILLPLWAWEVAVGCALPTAFATLCGAIAQRYFDCCSAASVEALDEFRGRYSDVIDLVGIADSVFTPWLQVCVLLPSAYALLHALLIVIKAAGLHCIPDVHYCRAGALNRPDCYDVRRRAFPRYSTQHVRAMRGRDGP